MGEALKIMDSAINIEITDEDRKAAMEMLKNAPSFSIDETISKYRKVLDQYLIDYNAATHYDLVCRADEGNEFPAEVSCNILKYYSFIERYREQ